MDRKKGLLTLDYSSSEKYIFIEPIEDENYNSLLKKTVTFLDEILIYGQYTYGLTQEVNSKNHSDSVIIFLLRSSLETLDGIKALFESSSIRPSKSLVRNLFEHMLYFDYIFSEKNLVHERALSYEVIDILKRIKNYKLLDFNDTTYEKERNIIGIKNFPNISKEKLSEIIINLENIFQKYSDYNTIYNKVLKNKKYHKSKTIPAWYSLYSEATTIRELCKLLNMEMFYLTLYSDLSNKVHPGDAMRAIIGNNDNTLTIRNPKIPYDTLEVATIISNTLTFSSTIYSHVIKHFMPNDDHKNCAEWYFYMRNNSNILENNWINMKFY